MLAAAAGSLAAAPARHAPPAHHAAAPARTGKTWTITIQQLAFGPAPPGMHVGDTVVWVNQSVFLHSATANDHSFDVAIPAHGQGTLKLTRAGTIPYTCKYHPGMKGQLVVGK